MSRTWRKPRRLASSRYSRVTSRISLGRKGCRSSVSSIGISTGSSSSSFTTPSPGAIMRYSRPLTHGEEPHGPVQSRDAGDDRKNRLLRPRPVWKDDKFDGHLRQARSQTEGKDALARDENRPHPLLRPPSGRHREGRRVQPQDPALYRPGTGDRKSTRLNSSHIP